MYVFIDESGIHKQIDHSSFVTVFVSVEDKAALNKKIEEIERRLKIKPFHWADFGSRFGWKIRTEFIKSVSTLSFSFKYIIVENPIKPQAMLYYALNNLLKEEDIIKVVIDGQQPKWYADQIKSSLRKSGISVKKLIIANDKADPILRLADALAGLVRSYHDGVLGAENLYQLIKMKNKITSHFKVGGQAHR
ncbi:MAG: DUF3800 domain-containing protein [Candidatus Komeilibacteria bacterium]|nr:DUF3800 domain-containing protein [Candidatus Komeilibacteria bacterium]